MKVLSVKLISEPFRHSDFTQETMRLRLSIQTDKDVLGIDSLLLKQEQTVAYVAAQLRTMAYALERFDRDEQQA